MEKLRQRLFQSIEKYMERPVNAVLEAKGWYTRYKLKKKLYYSLYTIQLSQLNILLKN